MADVLQVDCLLSADGWQTIGFYDDMPPPVRARLRESSFNLCAVCVVERAHIITGARVPSAADYMAAIDLMELALKQASQRV
jgi:hypothetical protein